MTLNIKRIISFKHLTHEPLGNTPIMALNNCGINAISGVSSGNSTLSVGEMTVLSNTFGGLMAKTPAGRTPSNITLPLLAGAETLKAHALQVGIRITQTAVLESQRGQMVLAVYNQTAITSQPIACTLTEDSSAYYEIVLSYKAPNLLQLQAFVNKQLTMSATSIIKTIQPLTLQISSGSFSVSAPTGYTVMFDDMYVAELDYNDDGTVTPQLLGDLSIEPFTVAGYRGDEHTNTKDVDIVTALNNFNPFEDMGVLAVKAGGAPASITFNTPNITGKTILGAALSVVYKDVIAPNNRIHYQITQGTTRHPAKTLSERHADVAEYTQFTQFVTTPAVGEVWNEKNLTFTLDVSNLAEEE